MKSYLPLEALVGDCFEASEPCSPERLGEVDYWGREMDLELNGSLDEKLEYIQRLCCFADEHYDERKLAVVAAGFVENFLRANLEVPDRLSRFRVLVGTYPPVARAAAYVWVDVPKNPESLAQWKTICRTSRRELIAAGYRNEIPEHWAAFLGDDSGGSR